MARHVWAVGPIMTLSARHKCLLREETWFWEIKHHILVFSSVNEFSHVLFHLTAFYLDEQLKVSRKKSIFTDTDLHAV